MTAPARKLPSSLVLRVVAAALVLFGSAQSAFADQLNFGLTLSNVGASRTARIYGTVALTLNSSGGIDVRITMAPGYQLSQGFGFDVVGSTTGLAVSDLSTGWSFPGTTLHLSKFGNFEAGVKSNPSNRYDSLSFTVTRTGGFTTVSQLVDLSTGGPLSAAFATKVFPAERNGESRYVGAKLTPVPEPATMTMLGLGLVGVAGLALWTSKRKPFVTGQ